MNLEFTAQKADEENEIAKYILSVILPDLPPEMRKPHWHPYLGYATTEDAEQSPATEAYVAWLSENRQRLQYDKLAGCLRIK
jgi:hypothetical protein